MTHRQISLDWFSQINHLTTVSLVIALLAFAIGFYAFGKTQKTKGSILTLGLCLTIGTWVFASAFIFSADPETGVWFWYYVQSFGFVPMWPILIHFFTLLSGLDRLPGKTLYVGRRRFTLNAPNVAVAVQYLLAVALHIWILTGAGEPLVITSYSIHYTKLYDTMVEPRTAFEMAFAPKRSATLTRDFTMPIRVESGMEPFPIPSL